MRGGLAVLDEFIARRSSSGLDALRTEDALLFRSIRTLAERLQMCLDMNVPPDSSLFSPADGWALSDLAHMEPAHKVALDALRTVLER